MIKDRLARWFSRPTIERGTNTVAGMPVILATDVGLVREENQDRVAAMRVNTGAGVGKPFVVLALVDGMGGMRNGSECAVRAISAFLNGLIRFRQKFPKERLELAANVANKDVFEFARGGGGATLSALLVSRDHDTLALNIGDSRIYATVADGDRQDVSRLTVDDSLEEVVGGHGKDLLQFVGMGDGLIPHISVVPKNSKRVLITCDGIHLIRHESLCDSLINASGIGQVAEQLVTLAGWRGAPDNASLAITDLPELNQSLSVSQETGVEIWDPFSSLHIMWLKLEEARLFDPGLPRSSEVVQQPTAPAVQPKPTRNARKSRSRKVEKKAPVPVKNPELTIEISSDVNRDKEQDRK